MRTKEGPEVGLLGSIFKRKDSLDIMKLDLTAPSQAAVAVPPEAAPPPQSARYFLGEWSINVGADADRKAEAAGVLPPGQVGGAAVSNPQRPKPSALRITGVVTCPCCTAALPLGEETVLCAAPFLTPRGKRLRRPEFTLVLHGYLVKFLETEIVSHPLNPAQTERVSALLRYMIQNQDKVRG